MTEVYSYIYWQCFGRETLETELARCVALLHRLEKELVT
jgi:hypothetical protein